MKNIVISGCSMSSDVTSLDDTQRKNAEIKDYKAWPHFLDSLNENFTIFNASQDGADNGTIYRNLKNLFEQNSSKNDWSDTIVFIQWSAIDRHSIFVEEDNQWLLSSQHNDLPAFQKYYKEEHDEEKALQNTLDNISKAQKFLKSKNIKYKMFTGWNIFSDDVDFESNDIDISKFWFHLGEHWNTWEKGHSNIVKYGGMNEWIRENISQELWSRESSGIVESHPRDLDVTGDKHPSNASQMHFCQQIIYKLMNGLERE